MNYRLRNHFYTTINVFFVFLAFLLCPHYIRSDLPAHCLADQTVGYWEFYIDSVIFDASLEDEKTNCGHGFPDRIEKTLGDTSYPFAGIKTIGIELKLDYKIYQEGVEVGNWTPVYDQSFIIYYRNSILTAAYKYYKDPNTGSYTTKCDKSMVGWYIPDSNNNRKNWSCMYGIKKSGQFSSFLQTKKVQTSFTQLTTNSKLDQVLKYEHLHKVVKEINDANLLWKADVNPEFVGLSFVELREHLGLNKGKNRKYDIEEMNTKSKVPNQRFMGPALLQKTTEDANEYITKDLKEFLDQLDKEESELFSEKKNEEKLTMRKESKLQGQKTETKSIPSIEEEEGREKDSKYVTDYAEISKYFNTPLDEIPASKLPKNWDWANVGGKNYVPHAKKQGACGSCYVFSSVTSLESRLRIRTNNNDMTEFSKQFPISCNFYAEGCEGGYPILVGKFFNEFEIVPDECFKYTETNNKCSNVCDYGKNRKKYHVSKYGYLGGFYGGSTEELMLKELRARGPIPGNLQIPVAFNYYKSGIFSQSSLVKNSHKLSKTRMIDRNRFWEKVEHSITLVGYGESNGVKYWIGLNTWGSSWGENGFFKILRGENDCSIETMGDFLDIEILDH